MAENVGDLPDREKTALVRANAYQAQLERVRKYSFWVVWASAALALTAAISSGLQIQWLGVITGAVSAAISVIGAGYRFPTTMADSEKGRVANAQLANMYRDYLDDAPGLSQDAATKRMEKIRQFREETNKLPAPDSRFIEKAEGVAVELLRAAVGVSAPADI